MTASLSVFQSGSALLPTYLCAAWLEASITPTKISSKSSLNRGVIFSATPDQNAAGSGAYLVAMNWKTVPAGWIVGFHWALDEFVT